MNSSSTASFHFFEQCQILRNASWQAGVATLLLCIWSLVIYRLSFHPLAHIPGPPLAKLCGWWRNSRYLRGSWHDDILEVHRKYGRIVRIAPNELSIVDAEVARQLYGHGHNAKKTTWYNVWKTPGGAPAIFEVQDKKLHAFLRKRVAGAYSMTAILKLETYIQSCLDLMFNQLRKYAEVGENVDMASWTSALAFDVVGELAYGSKLGHLETESDVMGIRKGIYFGIFASANLGHYPGQARLLNNKLMTSLLEFLGKPNLFLGFQSWCAERVQSRMENTEPGTREDMLTHFIRMKDDKGESAAFPEVLMETMNLVGAGADTTSIGMRTCLFYICSRPDVYRTLQKAIDDYYDAMALTAPITYQQTQQLPYLVAVCKEAMRLLLSIVYQLLRYATDGLTVDGKHIPAGTPVGVSPIAQNRDQEVFGADADDFRPERWLEDEQKTRFMDSVNMTFGGNGPRMCVGRNIALVEIHKFIAQLLRNFDVGIVDSNKSWHITSYFFAYQHDMHMWIKPRPCARLRGSVA
ncbi:hypothetical protein H2200_009588 [Cladophialophora chaetospira]|uniref:Cytochrome P450 n=1 Tax=Cladophialophora chaetospira TaxID=386627 RepID=A0AA38X2T5_9EURO|nr:hypothetical protein H2200_009588 [Cladophialophora chaetospira]